MGQPARHSRQSVSGPPVPAGTLSPPGSLTGAAVNASPASAPSEFRPVPDGRKTLWVSSAQGMAPGLNAVEPLGLGWDKLVGVPAAPRLRHEPSSHHFPGWAWPGWIRVGDGCVGPNKTAHCSIGAVPRGTARTGCRCYNVNDHSPMPRSESCVGCEVPDAD